MISVKTYLVIEVMVYKKDVHIFENTNYVVKQYMYAVLCYIG